MKLDNGFVKYPTYILISTSTITRDRSDRNRKIPNRLFESHFAKDMDSAG
jgi:hypothetical protein